MGTFRGVQGHVEMYSDVQGSGVRVRGTSIMWSLGIMGFRVLGFRV